MRGAMFSVAQKIVVATLVALLLIVPSHTAQAAGGGLDLARDSVGTYIPDAPNIYHDIYFVLPVDATQVKNTDWLLIDLPNYRFVSADGAFLIGGFGSPNFQVIGNQVRISNFALLPGNSLSISGIHANNPDEGVDNHVSLKIATDSSGTVVRNQVTLIPTEGKNVVNVTASILTETSAVTISGYTSPTTFVTLTEGSSVLATTVSDLTGVFNFNISGIDPGTHTFAMYATDALNRSTSETTLTIFLLANMVTSASGILLSPSLSLDKSQIHSGDLLTISGSSKPNSQINIFLEAPLRSYVASSNSSGAWSYVVPSSETTLMSPGAYRVYAVTQDSNGGQSNVSPTLNFSVITVTTGSNPAPACDISHGDLNCNGVTNLVDFSILLYHWNTNHRVADINKDGTVNLVDFSIMMFYYSG